MKNIDIQTEVLEDIQIEDSVKELLNPNNHIVLYNDDVNSFDHVIECLIEYCDHIETQAEQCAHIIHNNGKCSVKGGSMKKLKPICEALLEKGLSAKIE